MPDVLKNLFSGSVLKGVGGVVTVVTALIGALLGLGVIHGANGGKDPLAAAAVKTSDAGSSRIDITRIITSGSKTILSETGHGEFDYRAVIGKLDYTDGLKQIFLKPFLYEQPPSQQIWCAYDASDLGGGLFFGAITGFKSDPGAALTNLSESGSHKKVGEETLFGVPTTHYTGYVDLARLSEKEPDPTIRKYIDALRPANRDRLPVDVWVGSDNLVLRLKASFDALGTDLGLNTTDKLHTDATFDFSRFGVNVSVAKPPPLRTFPPGKQGCPQTP